MNYNRLLEGKTALITSGAMGIGKETAVLFAKQGAKIIIADIHEKELNKTTELIKKICPSVESYVCDMGDKEQIYFLAKKINRVDILINSVGINQKMIAHEVEEDVLDNILDVNFKSGYRFMKTFIPEMIKQGGGTIVNISSIHSIMTMPGNSAYAASKGAVNAMSRAIALDYAKDNIRINNIALGYIMSDMNKIEVAYKKNDREQERVLIKKYQHLQPLKAATCLDVANTVLYLASNMSNYLTGQTICLDGGASIRAH